MKRVKTTSASLRDSLDSGPEVFLLESLLLIAIPSTVTSTHRQSTSAEKAMTDASDVQNRDKRNAAYL